MKLVGQLEETSREFTKGVGYDIIDIKMKNWTDYNIERRPETMETVIINITARTRRDQERRREWARRELRRLITKWVVEVIVGLICLGTFDKVADPVIGGVLLGVMVMTLPKSILDVNRWETRRPKLLRMIEETSTEEEVEE